MHKPLAVFLTVACLVALPGIACAAAPASDIAVQVDKDGATFTVKLDMTVAASVDETWEVLTDFDKMAQILSNVDASEVVKREGNVMQVAQKSHATAGLIKLSLESTRQVELVPNKEIRSRLLKGDLKSSEFTTRVAPNGTGVRVTVEGKFVAGGLSAAALTAETVTKQTRRQYQELRDEVLRRKSKQPPPPCILAKNCEQSSSG